MTVITEIRLSCDLSDCPYTSSIILDDDDPRDVPAPWIVAMFGYVNVLADLDGIVMQEHHFCSVAHLKLFITRNTDIIPDPDDLLPAHWGIK